MLNLNEYYLYKLKNLENSIINLILTFFPEVYIDIIYKCISDEDLSLNNFFLTPTNYKKSIKLKNFYKEKFNSFKKDFFKLNEFLTAYSYKKYCFDKLKYLVFKYKLNISIGIEALNNIICNHSFLSLAGKLKLYLKNREYLKNKLVLNNMRLVNSIANKYKLNTHMELLDLINEGTFGLMKAIDMIDITKNIKLTTYSFYWINYYISNILYKKESLVSVPVLILKRIKKLRKILDTYYINTNSVPSESELSALMGLKKDYIHNLKKYDIKVIQNIDNIDNYLEYIPKESLSTIIFNNFQYLTPDEAYITATYFKLPYLKPSIKVPKELDKSKLIETSLNKLRVLKWS